MARSPMATNPARLPPLLVVGLVAAGLYFAREVLIPIALAILLAFLLAPLVRILERGGLRRSLAAALAVGVAVCGIGVVGWVVGGQVVELASQLPEYKDNLKSKLLALRASDDNVFSRAERTITELRNEVAAAAKVPEPPGEPGSERGTQGSRGPTGPHDDGPRVRPGDPGAPGAGGVGGPQGVSGSTGLDRLSSSIVTRPTPVQVVESSPLGVAQFLLGPIVAPLATVGIALVLAMFLLIQREDIRNRFLRLVGSKDLPMATQALDDASDRVSRYLIAQSLLNGSVGLIIALGLFLLNVPNAALFGLLIAVLRFIPYVGYWLAGALPLAVAAASSPGWYAPLLVFALLVTVELVAGNIVEPVVQSSKAGVSTMAILAAALFWAWLWGSIGLLLATPLTVCLAVLGRHVPQFEFLNVLLGDEPVLSPESRLYQRLLAMDQDEASRIVESEAGGKAPAEVFDALIVPALRLAKADLHRGNLDDDQGRLVVDAIGVIVEDMAAPSPDATASGPVVCVPGFDHADEVAANMLAQLLSASGVSTTVVPSDALSSEAFAQMEGVKPVAVALACLPPQAIFHARYRAKRLRARFPELPIVIGVLSADGDSQPASQRLQDIKGIRVVTTLTQAVDTLKALASVDAVDAVAQPAITSGRVEAARPRR